MQGNQLPRDARSMNFRYLLPLTMLYLTIYLISVSIAYKMVNIGIALDPAPPFIFPLTYAISDIIAEVYGLGIAKKVIWLTLLCQFFFAFAIYLLIHLPSPGFWHHQAEYNYVFGHIIQFVFSGFVAVVSSSFVNVYIISKWKVLMHGKHLWFRCLASSLIGGFVLISVIVVFAYANHLGEWQLALKMFVSIYVLETLYAMLLVFPTWLTCGLLKRVENIDVYDTKATFNPFKFN